MNKLVIHHLLTLLLALTCAPTILAQGTAFSYQGRLSANDGPANGAFDLTFALFDSATNGNQIGTVVTNAPVAVRDGLFVVTLDFGAAGFSGDPRWLEITVRTNASAEDFTVLVPRQSVLPAPYAIHAATAGGLTGNPTLTGVITFFPTSGPPFVVSNDLKVELLNADLLDGLDGAAFAPVSHEHAAENIVSGTLADVRLSTNVALLSAHQVFSGSNVFSGASVLTNEANLFSGIFAGDGLGLTNLSASNLVGTVSDSLLSSNVARLDSGLRFAAPVTFDPSSGEPPFAVSSSARVNDLNSDLLDDLDSSAFWKTAGNTGTATDTDFLGTIDFQPLVLRVNNERALRLNPTLGSPIIIGGFSGNQVDTNAVGAAIGGGGSSLGPNEIGPGFFPNRPAPDYAVIGGGSGNSVMGAHGTISGGDGNSLRDSGFGAPVSSTIGGGAGNVVLNEQGSFSTIAGGSGNRVRTDIRGGANSTIAGGSANRVEDSSNATIGGGSDNCIEYVSSHGTIGGGEGNRMLISRWSTVGGGAGNYIFHRAGVISGGVGNTLDGGQLADYEYAVIAGGLSNHVNRASYAVIAGGMENFVGIGGFYAAIAGGQGNSAQRGYNGAVGGGARNAAIGNCATIPGGEANVATNYSLAAGRRARAVHDGSFVWGDSTDADVASTANDQFTVRAAGGARFLSDTNGSAGVELAPGSGAWSSLSDRNAKRGFTPVEPREVLEKLATVPIQEWSYKSQDASIRHLGPTAQDFRAAFGVGEDERRIATVDADGVALAAIQGLNEIVHEQRAELKIKAERIQALEERLNVLEKLVGEVIENRGVARR